MFRGSADSGQEREEQRHAAARSCDVTTEFSGGGNTSHCRVLGRIEQELQPPQHCHTERFVFFIFIFYK